MQVLYFWNKNTMIRCVALLLLLTQGSRVAAADGLDALITESVGSYPSVKSKEMLQRSAQSDVTSAKLGFLPNASVSYEPRRKVYGGDASSSTGRDAYAVVTVTQPLLGGGLVSNYRQSKAALSASDWALREEAEAVALKVINGYVAWRLAHQKVKAAQDNIKEYERFVGLITHRAEAGASPVTDQNLGVSRLLQAKSELASYLSSETTALTGLSQLMGRRLTRDELLKQSLAEPQTPFEHDVVARALEINPAIKRLEFVAQAVEQASKAQRAQAYPQVVLQAKREIGSLTANDAPAKTTVGLLLNYTTGAGFSSITKASAAYSRYEAALMDVEVAKRDVVVKVNQDVSDYTFAKSRAQVLVKNAELTKTVSQSYDRLFLVGKKSWLDLMNAVRERKDTQIALADAQAQILLTARRLQIYAQGLDYNGLGLKANNTN